MEKKEYLDLYRKMYLIRRFEESCGENYSKGFIRGFLHLYIGEEAIAVGSITPLREDDFIVTHYRDHGHAIARGLETGPLMAELFGKKTGVSGGKGGSMHLFDAGKNFMGGHAIVGAQIPLAAGFALASQYQNKDSITVVYFGDGATNQGTFHETMNLASVWKLPILFFLENNFYGMGTSVERIRNNGKSFGNLAENYSIPSTIVDGMDVLAVKEVTEESIKKVRSGSGPAFIEATTFRFQGHSMADPAKYRAEKELEEWKKKDPLINFNNYLIKEGIAADIDIEKISKSVDDELEEAVKFATESPEPDLNDINNDIYA
ncbi:MAG: pyruvate dehydrogenase (acetyl-transferring) E1 component subunit alpha [Chloroflexi bacterium]|nr:pyruvate dehydrogenase (acetyl-transferring) E1 component subunit alpha [Chloroflexota bacterium]|tara:strand:- start:9657 stop:10613 length:957 start_codon:yes stop_codon:yes gene_type:complete